MPSRSPSGSRAEPPVRCRTCNAPCVASCESLRFHQTAQGQQLVKVNRCRPSRMRRVRQLVGAAASRRRLRGNARVSTMNRKLHTWVRAAADSVRAIWTKAGSRSPGRELPFRAIILCARRESIPNLLIRRRSAGVLLVSADHVSGGQVGCGVRWVGRRLAPYRAVDCQGDCQDPAGGGAQSGTESGSRSGAGSGTEGAFPELPTG